VESSCELGNEPSGYIKCWELPSGCTTCGLSSGTQLNRVSGGRSVGIVRSRTKGHEVLPLNGQRAPCATVTAGRKAALLLVCSVSASAALVWM
jgi:hypothetical protein